MSWAVELPIKFHNWWNGVAKAKAALTKDENALRIGVLGAANINYTAIFDPVESHPGAIIAGVAARSQTKAEAQINRYKITGAKAYASYDDLISDPSIDAVYIPLPNGLHFEWAMKCLDKGKHVLIEKPICNNLKEAQQIRDKAKAVGKVALEAFHWRFHPAAHTVKDLVESGKYGNVQSISARMGLPSFVLAKDDIRFNYKLGGGACMDLTYVFCASSYFASPDITKCTFNVTDATARISAADKNIDEAMTAKFTVEQPEKPPVTCSVDADLVIAPILGFIPRLMGNFYVGVEMEKAKIDFPDFPIAWLQHTITVHEKDSQGKLTGKKEYLKCYEGGPQWGEGRGKPWYTTYRYQLEAFVDMINSQKNGKPYHGPWMTLDESCKIMELIDSVYHKAGLPTRGEMD